MKTSLLMGRGGLILASLLIFLCLGSTSFAQHVILIKPGLGTLDSTIDADTLSDGTHPDAIYQFERGGVYLYESTVKNNFKMTLEAVGTGAMPIIMPASALGGGRQVRPFEPYGDITVKGIMFSNYDNSTPPIGATNGFIRVMRDSVTMTIDSCRFDGNIQEALRFAGADGKLFVTNSVFSNNYDPDSPNDGWILYIEKVMTDSIVFDNCTFYSTDYWSKKPMNDEVGYYKITHCTFDNFSGIMKTIHPDSVVTPSEFEASRYGSISTGGVEYFVFRDNLLVNPAFIGTENPSWSTAYLPRYIVNSDSMYNDSTKSLVPPLGEDIRNNDIWLDPSLTYPDSMEAYPKADWYDPTCMEFVNKKGSNSTLLNVNPDFKNAPGSPQQYINDWFAENANAAQPPFYMPETSFDPNYTGGYASLDFSYTASALMNASTQGQPLGDLQWFNMQVKHTPDVFSSITAVQPIGTRLPNKFSLSQNYPNPFNPSTQINYTVPVTSLVTIDVFNVLGQKVATLFSGERQPGSYTVMFDAGKFASGVYFYRLSAGNYSSVRKMMFVK